MGIKTSAFVIALGACAALASAEDARVACPEWALQPCAAPARDRREPVRVWDPNLAQWRTEHPREVWDPNLAQYRYERRDEVWDPYLAQYRPRDAKKDPPPGRERRSENRRRR
jgi:hypothetical protein